MLHYWSKLILQCTISLVIRESSENGIDINEAITKYHKFEKPTYEKYIRKTVRNADVIIPRGTENKVAIDLITKHIAMIVDDLVI